MLEDPKVKHKHKMGKNNHKLKNLDQLVMVSQLEYRQKIKRQLKKHMTKMENKKKVSTKLHKTLNHCFDNEIPWLFSNSFIMQTYN